MSPRHLLRTMNRPAPQLYRPCVGLCLLNASGLVFVGERLDTPDAWQMPQGGIDPGEDIEAAAFRELREELGVGVTVGDRLGDDVPLSPTTTLRAYRVTLVDGTVHPHDHRELRWVTRDELAGLPWVPADTAWLPDLYAALETR